MADTKKSVDSLTNALRDSLQQMAKSAGIDWNGAKDEVEEFLTEMAPHLELAVELFAVTNDSIWLGAMRSVSDASRMLAVRVGRTLLYNRAADVANLVFTLLRGAIALLK